jgi:excisionase family DNA binding protein
MHWIQHYLTLGAPLTNGIKPKGARPPDKNKGTYLIGEIADAFDVSERTIYRLVKNGSLNGRKVGKEWHFEEADIKDFIGRQRRAYPQRKEFAQGGEHNGKNHVRR